MAREASLHSTPPYKSRTAYRSLPSSARGPVLQAKVIHRHDSVSSALYQFFSAVSTTSGRKGSCWQCTDWRGSITSHHQPCSLARSAVSITSTRTHGPGWAKADRGIPFLAGISADPHAADSTGPQAAQTASHLCIRHNVFGSARQTGCEVVMIMGPSRRVTWISAASARPRAGHQSNRPGELSPSVSRSAV